MPKASPLTKGWEDVSLRRVHKASTILVPPIEGVLTLAPMAWGFCGAEETRLSTAHASPFYPMSWVRKTNVSCPMGFGQLPGLSEPFLHIHPFKVARASSEGPPVPKERL